MSGNWKLAFMCEYQLPLVPLIFLGMTKVAGATQIMQSFRGYLASMVPPPTLWIFQFNQRKAARTADHAAATCSFVMNGGTGQMVMVEDGVLRSAVGAQRERQHLNTSQDPGPAQHTAHTHKSPAKWPLAMAKVIAYLPLSAEPEPNQNQANRKVDSYSLDCVPVSGIDLSSRLKSALYLW